MMNTSLDTEHLKPRVSEQLRSKGIPAAPRGGIHSRSAGGYGSATLEGNWYEDRYDSRFADKQTVLPTALDQSWRTTYHAQVGRRGWNGGAAHDSGNASCSLLAAPLPPLGHLPPLDPSTQLTRPTLGLLATLDSAAGDAPATHIFGTSTRTTMTSDALRKSLGSRHAVSQSELVEIAAGRHRAFPGHQPERDLPPKQSELEAVGANGKPLMMTEQRRSYGDPEARHRKSQTNAVDLFAGAPSDKPAFVVFKIKVGLKQRVAGGAGSASTRMYGTGSNSSSFGDSVSGLQQTSPTGGSMRWRPPPAVKRGGRNASALPVLSEASTLHLTALKNGIVVDRNADAEAAAAAQHAAVATNYSFAALRRALKAAEARPLVAGGTKSRPGMVNLAEVQAGLASYGLDNVTAEDATVLFKQSDPAGTGEVDLVKFIAGIRGSMNERRRSVVQQAFGLIERTVLRVHGRAAMSTKTPGQSMVEFNVFRSSMSPTFGKASSGGAGVVVLMSNLIELFDAESHPDVRSGTATPDEVCRQLFDDFFYTTEAADGGAKARLAADEVITLQRFTELYEDWSALVDADHHFEAAVRGCWHLTGGIGVAGCMSNLQVEVVHTNGRITTQVIRDDLAISAEDFDLMQARLAEQGIKDVNKLRVL